jgi:hypothetical protein
VKKIYHPYWLWEEYINGMWRNETPEYERDNIQKIIEFTGNHIEYGNAMFEVIENWNYSCEDKLSNISINRKAWIGHAACCFKHGYPEYLVRQAWKQLTDKQRELANIQAENAIKQWERNQRSKTMLKYGKIDVTPMVFQIQDQSNWKQMDLFPHIEEFAKQL